MSTLAISRNSEFQKNIVTFRAKIKKIKKKKNEKKIKKNRCIIEIA